MADCSGLEYFVQWSDLDGDSSLVAAKGLGCWIALPAEPTFRVLCRDVCSPTRLGSARAYHRGDHCRVESSDISQMSRRA